MLLHHRQLTQATGSMAVGIQGTATAVDTNGVETATGLVMDTTGVVQSIPTLVTIEPLMSATVISITTSSPSLRTNTSTSSSTSNPSYIESSPQMGVIFGVSAGVGTLTCGLSILLLMIYLRKRQRRRTARFVYTTEPKPFLTEDQQGTQDSTSEDTAQTQRVDGTTQALDAPRLSISKSLGVIQSQRLDEPITPSQIEQGTPSSETHVPQDQRRSQQTDIWNDRDTIADPDATPPPTYSTGGRRSRRTLIFSPDGGDIPPVPPPPFEP